MRAHPTALGIRKPAPILSVTTVERVARWLVYTAGGVFALVALLLGAGIVAKRRLLRL